LADDKDKDEEKKKKRKKSAWDSVAEMYEKAAKSGAIGARAKVTAERKRK